MSSVEPLPRGQVLTGSYLESALKADTVRPRALRTGRGYINGLWIGGLDAVLVSSDFECGAGQDIGGVDL